MKALIFDTETTQLIVNSLIALEHQPRVIEFYGMLAAQPGHTEDVLEFLCHPGHPLSAETTKITGIKDSDLATAQPFAAHAQAVVDLIGRADVVVAHNLSYDKAVIDYELRRHGLAAPWPRRLICTVEATEHLRGHRLRLSALHELLFGEPFDGAHRAANDVQALARCYWELVERGEL